MRALLLLLLLAAAAPAERPWRQVRNFAIQLQNAEVEKIHRSPYDLVIVDYSADGGPNRAFTPAQVARMKKKPNGGRRLLVAYLSVGEAEDYRFYWRPGFKTRKPSWLGKENPQWRGNYKVRFWEEPWQAITLDYLDRIVRAGFDGAFLDTVDTFESYEEWRPTAGHEMSRFVQRLAAAARKAGGADFGIFPNNAERLLKDPPFFAAITGVVREETYYGMTGDNVATPANETAKLERALDRLVKSGKLVLGIDYTDRPEQIEKAKARSQRRGYLQYVAPRALDRLDQAWKKR